MAPGLAHGSSEESDYRKCARLPHEARAWRRHEGWFSTAVLSVSIAGLCFVVSFASACAAGPPASSMSLGGGNLIARPPGADLEHGLQPVVSLPLLLRAATAQPLAYDPGGPAVVADIPENYTPTGTTYDSARGEVFVTNGDSSYVRVISDGTDRVVARVWTGGAQSLAAYDAAKGEVFVTDLSSSSVDVINDTNDTVVATIPVGSGPWGIAYDAAQGRVFVTDEEADSVSVIADTNDTIVATIAVGTHPTSAVFDVAKDEVFVGNWGNVSVIDGLTDKVVATVPIGVDAREGAYDPQNGEVFVTNNCNACVFNGAVSVINDTNDTVVATIPVGSGPWGAAYDAAKEEVFITNALSNNVSVISTATNTVVATVSVGGYPLGAVYAPTNGQVFVADALSNDVRVLSDASFPVTFYESGLPSGSAWWVNTTGGLSWNATGSTLSKFLGNGTYAFSVASVDYSHSRGTFAVNGEPLTMTVSFTKETFSVTFTEQGPTSKSAERKLAQYGWTVVLNGTPESDRGSTITFDGFTNGTYPVLIMGPSGIESSGSGSVTVHGATAVHVTLTKGKTLTLTFHERGLSTGQAWSLEVNGWAKRPEGSVLRFENLSMGTYSIAVTSPLVGQNITIFARHPFYGPDADVALTRSVTAVVQFVYNYKVTFNETGLPSGGIYNNILWFVKIRGQSEGWAFVGHPIMFHLPNGTYHYKLGNEFYSSPKFKGKGSPSPLVVVGAPVSVAVTFSGGPVVAPRYSSGVASILEPATSLVLPIALAVPRLQW